MSCRRQRIAFAAAFALAVVTAAVFIWPAGASPARESTRDDRTAVGYPVADEEGGTKDAGSTEGATGKAVTPEKDATEKDTTDKQDAPPAEVAIAAAKAQLGTPYRWAGSGPGGFDCSGLVLYAYAKAGITLPHNSSAQFNAVKRIPTSKLRPGDLVFSGWGGIGHVGLYIGDGKMIHSPQSGKHVEIAPLRRNLIGAGRPIA